MDPKPPAPTASDSPPAGGLSRRGAFRAVATICGASLAFIAAPSGWGQTQTRKNSKQTVQYQYNPRNGHKCAECRYFIEGGKCRLVQGDISPNGWCMLWTKKA